MENLVQTLIKEYKQGRHIAIPSYCTGNKRVIEAILEYYKDKDSLVLFEATANQVNQFGGYTGMQPLDYKNMVLELARKIKINPHKILLGGDHLGPLVWCKEPEKQAMDKAQELVKLFVSAGYQKIHLDTSMRLADDPKERVLSKKVIAQRGALLCRVCEDTFKEYKRKYPEAVHPVYIIGSEVPIPGGSSGEENQGLHITEVNDFQETIKVYKEEFAKIGLQEAFNYIVGIVVQPGVEFNNDGAVDFVPEKAQALAKAIKDDQQLVLEGHSTDYQMPVKLKAMVESGVVILKVGPALTFAYREAIMAMEQIMFAIEGYTGFSKTLMKVMLADDKNWKNHYSSTSNLKLYLQYSFSDRCRYYLGAPEVVRAIEVLKYKFNATEIPLFLIHQYLPLQYSEIREGNLKVSFDSIINNVIGRVIDNYEYAAGNSRQNDLFV
jgi:D-tagatose-1,6-bisphosphate aldolase subunit GatZ/KbaZ